MDQSIKTQLAGEFYAIWQRKMHFIVQDLGIDIKMPHKRNSRGNLWRDAIDWMPKKVVSRALTESELNTLKLFIDADMWPYPENGNARARKAAGLAVWSAMFIVTVDTQDEITEYSKEYVPRAKKIAEAPEQRAASDIDIEKYIFSLCCKDPAFMEEWKDNGGMKKTEQVLGREVMANMYRNHMKLNNRLKLKTI